ncbi:MAG: YibE/F family protein [Patescibacteria group bacterium]|nr:YibE/F family protein [Patescibacteria group bacterium]
MKKRLYNLFLLLFAFLLFFPFTLQAQQTEGLISFTAKVVEIKDSVSKTSSEGGEFTQQNLYLEAISGPRQGEFFLYEGISEVEVANQKIYQVGDKVFVDVFSTDEGGEIVYVTEYVRSKSLLILAFIFIVIFLLIGKGKGLRALLSLVLTFIIIIKFILPLILAGHNPFLISLAGGLIIMILVIYITEGWKRKSHLAILAVIFSLLVTLILSLIFTSLTRLTGMAQEETVYLLGLGSLVLDFRGLLLAGILIGAIGVLDDIIVSQIEAVERIKEANPSLSPKRVFSLAYKIGNTHLGTMVNTLFLTYAGAALPLLLIFVLSRESGLDLSRAINSELISTEIIRTLVGSIGVMSAMPIATFLGAYGLEKWTKK